MSFEYIWHRNEANFGPTIEREVQKGTHFTIENILHFDGKFVALRRPEAVPNHEVPGRALKSGRPMLYFVHDLPIWGESLKQYINRIVMEQAGVKVASFRVIDLTMNTYEDSQQWALTPYVLVELESLPKIGTYGNPLTEVVAFTKDTIPDEFGWYEKTDIENLLHKIEG
jgi:hypothetical protein